MKITEDERKRYNERRKVYRGDIIKFAREICKIVPDQEQEKCLRLYQETGRLAVRAAHGVGKTALIVIVMFQHLWCYTNSRVPCTAPTLHQLRDVLWTEAARFMYRSRILNHFFTWSATKIGVKGKENLWHAIAIPSSNPNALAGMHDKNLLYLLDEGPGIKESAFPVIEGALTNRENKVIMIGNPVKITGYFADVFRRPQGWGTAKISRLDSRIPDLDPGYPERIANRWGKNSNIYRVRVLGEFPLSEDFTILPIDLVTDAMMRDEPLEKSDVVAGGCDVALSGKNKTVIYIRKGYEIIDSLVIDKAENPDNVAACMKMINKHHPIYFNIDKTGVGAGVYGDVKKECRDRRITCKVRGIDNGGTAVENEIYRNAGTEMYFNLRSVLKKAKIPYSDELLGGLTCRQYQLYGNLIWMPGKAEIMKKKDNEHVESFVDLDHADCLALTFYNPGEKKYKGEVKSFHEVSTYLEMY